LRPFSIVISSSVWRRNGWHHGVMYLIYVDESGDSGLAGSPTRYFVLSGFVVHELRWLATLDAIIDLRQMLRKQYGIKLREEIHASHFIHRPKDLVRIPKSVRLRILRDVLDFEAALPDVNVISVLVDKAVRTPPFDVFEFAWTALIQRFHNTISYRNCPGPQNPQDLGLILVDQTEEKRLRDVLRRMRRFNPVPSMFGVGTRQIPVATIAEDPNPRDSRNSYFTQLSDVNAFFLTQKLVPSQYVRKKGARNYFDRLDPILCKVAAISDPQGIVQL
jgi:Protein of unknown function (DUF3800)